MKASFPPFARIWILWMSQKRGKLKFGGNFYFNKRGLTFILDRASMIWIIGEYAERIDNADELLESFLEGFHDENTQVRICQIFVLTFFSDG